MQRMERTIIEPEKKVNIEKLLGNIKNRVFEDTRKELKVKKESRQWWLGGKFGLTVFYNTLQQNYPFAFGRGEEYVRRIKQTKKSLVDLFLQTAKEMGYEKVVTKEQIEDFVDKNIMEIVREYQQIVDSFMEEAKKLYTNPGIRKQDIMNTRGSGEKFSRKSKRQELAKVNLQFELGKVINRELGLNAEGKVEARIGTVQELNRIKNGIIEGHFGFGKSGIAKLIGREQGKLEILKDFLINTFGAIKSDAKNWDELILSSLYNITLENSEARRFIEARRLAPQTDSGNRQQVSAVSQQDIDRQTRTSLGQVRLGANNDGVSDERPEGAGENQGQQRSQRIGWRDRARNAFASLNGSFKADGGVKSALGMDKAQEWLQKPTPVPSFRNLKIEARAGYVAKTAEEVYKIFFAKHAAWLRQEIQKSGRDFAACKKELESGFLRDFPYDRNGLTEDSKLRIVDILNNSGLRIFDTQSRQLVVDTPEKIKLIEVLIGVHGTNIDAARNFEQAKEAVINGLSYYMEAEINKIEKENPKLAYTRGLAGKIVDTFRPLANSGPGLAARQVGLDAAKSTGKFLLKQGEKGGRKVVDVGMQALEDRRVRIAAQRRQILVPVAPARIAGPGYREAQVDQNKVAEYQVFVRQLETDFADDKIDFVASRRITQEQKNKITELVGKIKRKLMDPANGLQDLFNNDPLLPLEIIFSSSLCINCLFQFNQGQFTPNLNNPEILRLVQSGRLNSFGNSPKAILEYFLEERLD